MNHITVFLIGAVVLIGSLQACGPDEEELRQQQIAEEQARQDSIKQAMEAEREQMRQDELEQQAREESMAEEVDSPPIEYNPDGRFTVQVQSWRSREKAEKQAKIWQDRGFSHAYIVQFGIEEMGDIWFRVRLGNVSTLEMANRLKERIQNEHNTEAWIDMANTTRNN
ncbi:MAG: SPOR domain-containing protein [Balneolaceae bacterium]